METIAVPCDGKVECEDAADESWLCTDQNISIYAVQSKPPYKLRISTQQHDHDHLHDITINLLIFIIIIIVIIIIITIMVTLMIVVIINQSFPYLMILCLQYPLLLFCCLSLF